MSDSDWERWTLLHITTYQDQLTLTSVLLDSHTISEDSLFSKDTQGQTVVHFAATRRGLTFLKWLRDVGGQDIVTTPIDDGWTLLYWACRCRLSSNAK